ncbi:P-loop containing nucleoside triphosphate hydrolase protein [Dunaliella salina]|uniref:P-loop containing nucleoside triphosphate hydrolase protein n=1 Tax=Dunaliella salina TaxID=3046 RepID=A0ABQ7H8Q4_DUNSA|nr:P-loop containing nucleoside triphosphate hydrolase protein [Dunaliella salina]|eukprot:KAF5843236.1 P-loop containing nucleoside triphosphate hydrolase protein [Dunaliella salina]
MASLLGKLAHASPCRGTFTHTSASPFLRPSCPVAKRQRRQPLGRLTPLLQPECTDGSINGSGPRGGVVASASAILTAPAETKEAEVLGQLRNVVDPDFGEDIVTCGFIKGLDVNAGSGSVGVTIELTTPACPVKETFEQQTKQFIKELPWVQEVTVTMTSQPPQPLLPESGRPGGLRGVRNIIAVSSCKGGVGKSTVSVNLAYTLAQMGAKAIYPTEYEGVKVVSFGYAGQGSAIMRGPMVSGLIQQMLVTTEWGDLDYLVVDFPPGTGDIQLTMCQTVAFSAAVVVTTPQTLAFIDVAKGIRMFAKLVVPCVAVVENMSYFEVEGKRYFPFGKGSGVRIQKDFGLPNLLRFPIVPDLSAAGDGGQPLVIADPTGPTAGAFMELGAAVVREVAKMSNQGGAASKAPKVAYDQGQHVIMVRLPGTPEFALTPATVRRNDTSASSINEWTGARTINPADIPEDVTPESINPLGNYAVQILWQDGFNQIAAFELLESLRGEAVPNLGHNGTVSASVGGIPVAAQIS